MATFHFHSPYPFAPARVRPPSPLLLFLFGFSPQDAMPDMDFENPFFDIYNDSEFDFRTPVASPAITGRLQGSEQAISESYVEGPSPFPLCYTIDFKMRLRKGRLMKIADETIDNVLVAPGIYWEETLRSKLVSKAQDRVPEPDYEHRETIIIVSTSKRGEPPYKPPSSKQEIDWTEIENKLKSWSNPKHKLRVEFLAIYECLKAAPEKAGRGATKKHTAALEKLVAHQKATGAGTVWQEVYQLFHCTSDSCPNGFYCWVHDGRHRKLDDKVLDQLIDCAVEGMELRTHADVPDRIRDMIIAREEEDMQRKKRRAAASMPDRCCSHCRHSDNPPHGPDGLVKLNLPMPLNEAPKSLSDWLSAQVTDEDWKTAYQAAAEIAVKLGYDLEWLHNNKTAGAGILKEEGIMPGIAEQFVNKIMEWADKIKNKLKIQLYAKLVSSFTL
jgi:hypothetical protein